MTNFVPPKGDLLGVALNGIPHAGVERLIFSNSNGFRFGGRSGLKINKGVN